jgi:hypothetical protein
MYRISIIINEKELQATLFDTPTAKAIYNALPFDGQAQIWGDEIYFSIPVNVRQETDAREEVEIGDLAFWPVGSAFCIFFGRTPVSTNDKPRAYSPVNVFGKIEGSVEALKAVQQNSRVQVRKL